MHDMNTDKFMSPQKVGGGDILFITSTHDNIYKYVADSFSVCTKLKDYLIQVKQVGGGGVVNSK